MTRQSFLYTTLLFSIFSILLTARPASAQNYPDINGVQVFVLDKSYSRDIDPFFKGLKEHGVDTVFLRVFQNSSDRFHYLQDNPECRTGVYFKTSAACTVRDVLGEAVAAARKYHMKIFAWMATRSLSFLKTEKYMEKSFTRDGRADGYGASIFNPEAADRMRALFRDLAKYDIDGILFQDDFILRYNEGASDAALKAYRADTGISLTYKKLFGCRGGNEITKVPGGCPSAFIPWTKWKNERMMEFFQSLKIAGLEENPGLVFAGNVYYETPLSAEKGMSWYAQSIDSMLKFGFDYLAVMGYHDQIASELGISRAAALKLVEKMADSLKKRVHPTARILMKVQRVSFRKNAAPDSVKMKSVCAMLSKYLCISRVILPVNSLRDLKGTCFVN